MLRQTGKMKNETGRDAHLFALKCRRKSNARD